MMVAAHRLTVAMLLAVGTGLGSLAAAQAGSTRTARFASLCGVMDGTQPLRPASAR